MVCISESDDHPTSVPPLPSRWETPSYFLIQIKIVIMVTIVNFEKRKNTKDEEFNVLILQGGVETVTSKQTGKPYITARKTSIPCTFDDTFAESLVGTQMPGTIDRIPCDEYKYEIPGSKEVIKLTHTFQYSGEPANLEETVMG